MFKEKLILKISLSVVALGIIILCVFLLKSNFKPNYDGIITIEVVDLDGSIIKKQEINFVQGDELMTLVEVNFENVTYQNGMIMSIEDYVTPSDWSSYLCLYVDDKVSEVGMSDIKFGDGTKISIIITEFDNDWN